MTERIEQTIHFTTQSEEHTLATLVWTQFSEKERKLQAFVLLLKMWFLALLGLFIPIAHFVLVPGFLIGGIYIGYRKLTCGLKEADVASGLCPICKKDIEVKLESNKLPQWHYCPECSESLELKEQGTRAG